MLIYVDICWYMLIYVDICWCMLFHDSVYWWVDERKHIHSNPLFSGHSLVFISVLIWCRHLSDPDSGKARHEIWCMHLKYVWWSMVKTCFPSLPGLPSGLMSCIGSWRDPNLLLLRGKKQTRPCRAILCGYMQAINKCSFWIRPCSFCFVRNIDYITSPQLLRHALPNAKQLLLLAMLIQESSTVNLFTRKTKLRRLIAHNHKQFTLKTGEISSNKKKKVPHVVPKNWVLGT